MADVNAVDLTTETLATLDGNENVVLFDTAEGKKVTLKVLADYIVQKATESLLGSNQTVANALTYIMNTTISFTTLNSTHDIDNILSTGWYYIGGSKPSSIPPTATSYIIMHTICRSADLVYQILYNLNGEEFYIRKYSGNPPQWRSWYKYSGTAVS